MALPCTIGRFGQRALVARPEERLQLAARGYREANRPFELSLAIVLVGLLPYALGELRRSRKSVLCTTLVPGEC